MTLHHPHGQIYAYPYVTPRTQPAARRRSSGTSPDLFERILEFERQGPSGRSAAASTGPPSCRSPRAGRSRCTCCRIGTCPTSPRPAARSATSSPALYRRLLRGVDALYDTPTPYIAAWHQAPVERRPRHRAPAPRAHLAAPRRRQAQVPGGLRGGHGSLDRRRAARRRRRPDPRGHREHMTDMRDELRAQFAEVSGTPGRRHLVGARPGQPDRRAHRLQRRLRAAVRDRPAHPGRPRCPG